MKEAPNSPYNRLVFREIFSSETETRKQASSVTANQTSGLISGITTTNPLTIGNRSTATDGTFDGNIPMLKIYDGILDLEQISQIWSSTRGKVN
jgi:hypothetical protein